MSENSLSKAKPPPNEDNQIKSKVSFVRIAHFITTIQTTPCTRNYNSKLSTSQVDLKESSEYPRVSLEGCLDVKIGQIFSMNGIKYKQVTAYYEVVPGPQSIQVRLSESTKDILWPSFVFGESEYYTLLIFGDMMAAPRSPYSIRSKLIRDHNSNMFLRNYANVRFIHTCSFVNDNANVNLCVNGKPIFEEVCFGGVDQRPSRTYQGFPCNMLSLSSESTSLQHKPIEFAFSLKKCTSSSLPTAYGKKKLQSQADFVSNVESSSLNTPISANVSNLSKNSRFSSDNLFISGSIEDNTATRVFNNEQVKQLQQQQQQQQQQRIGRQQQRQQESGEYVHADHINDSSLRSPLFSTRYGPLYTQTMQYNDENHESPSIDTIISQRMIHSIDNVLRTISTSNINTNSRGSTATSEKPGSDNDNDYPSFILSFRESAVYTIFSYGIPAETGSVPSSDMGFVVSLDWVSNKKVLLSPNSESETHRTLNHSLGLSGDRLSSIYPLCTLPDNQIVGDSTSPENIIQERFKKVKVLQSKDATFFSQVADHPSCVYYDPSTNGYQSVYYTKRDRAIIHGLREEQLSVSGLGNVSSV